MHTGDGQDFLVHRRELDLDVRVFELLYHAHHRLADVVVNKGVEFETMLRHVELRVQLVVMSGRTTVK